MVRAVAERCVAWRPGGELRGARVARGCPGESMADRRRLLGLWGAWLPHVGDAAREALGSGLLATLVCVAEDAVADAAPLALDAPLGE